MAVDIGEWLVELGLENYAESFVENDVDFRALPHLDQEDLKELGVSLGHRKVILAEISKLHTAEPVAEAPKAAAPETSSTAAERRQLTVMFCDLVGSTELSGRLDPEDLQDVMRRYQDAMAGVVARYEGHVAKFLGDGVLAYFGWPRAHEDQAARAVRSGLAALEAVAHLTAEEGRPLSARVGIASGEVVIGDIIGDTATEKDAVIGETPNLAARLQSLASPGELVIGARTRLLIGDSFDLAEMGSHSLKGIQEPVAVWRVTGEQSSESAFAAAHPEARARIVGRAPELELLRRAWEQSRNGIGQAVLISGEPGIGKTLLVDAFADTLEDESYLHSTLRCSPYHINSALYPVISFLEQVCRWQREDDGEARLAKLEQALDSFSLPLDESVPLFAALLAFPVPEDRYPPLRLTPQQQKQETLDALVAWHLETAERRPVLQVWEDLHWADPSTIELIGEIIEQTPTAPIFNVLTFRPGFIPPWPQRSHMTPLTLNRLERPEAETLIDRQAGGMPLPEEVVEHIIAKTDGVPLYVEELTKAILEADFLHEADGRYQLSGPMSGLTIPATLQDSLMARLDRLPNIREVAQLGAVFGREFSYEMVAAIAPIDEAVLQNGLDELAAAELLYQRGRPPRAKYIFKHALLQDAAYQSLLKRSRQKYHEQVTELLQSRFPELVEAQPELIAHHFTEAGLAEPAANHWHAAGQQAIERSANPEAIGHLRKEFEVLMTLPESAERDRTEIALQAALGTASMAIKGYGSPEAVEAYERARHLCERIDETEKLFPVLFGMVIIHMIRAEHSDAVAAAESFLAHAEKQDDIPTLLESYLAVGVTAIYPPNLARSSEYIEKALELYDTEQHADLAFTYSGAEPGVTGMCYLAWTLWFLGDVDQAIASTDEAQSLVRRLDTMFTFGRSLYWDAMLRQLVGDWEGVRERSEEAIAMADEHGYALVRATGNIMLGWSRIHQSEYSQGAAQVRDGLDAYRATGARMQLPYLMIPLAEAERGQGQPQKGLDIIAEALDIAAETEERYMEAELHRLSGELLLDLAPGEHAPAEDAFRLALSTAEAQGAKSLELRAATSFARLRLAQNQIAEARNLLAPVFARFTEGFDTADLKAAQALLDELS